jgi:hypothetical protein
MVGEMRKDKRMVGFGKTSFSSAIVRGRYARDCFTALQTVSTILAIHIHTSMMFLSFTLFFFYHTLPPVFSSLSIAGIGN